MRENANLFHLAQNNVQLHDLVDMVTNQFWGLIKGK
jgi:hypothetical protein